MGVYTTAWKKGLKSTYYLHMQPRHTAEQSTTKVNKAEKMGKKGFASVASARKEDEGVVAPAPEAIPTPLSSQDIAVMSREKVEVAEMIKKLEDHPNASPKPPSAFGSDPVDPSTQNTCIACE